MFNIILAFDKNYGIAKNNELPWNLSLDMKFFKETIESKLFSRTTLIMGRKTLESLPSSFLNDNTKIFIVISNTIDNYKDNKNIHFTKNFTLSLELANGISLNNNNNVWVIGGARLYNEAFNHRELNNIYYTFIDHNFNCDTFINFPWELENKQVYSRVALHEIDRKTNELHKLIFYKMRPILDIENQYLTLLNNILKTGTQKMTRNGYTKSLFGKELNFDVSNNFPLLTTKKMFWKGIVEELLFFIRGDTNTKQLEEKGINIWRGNTSREFLDSNSLPYDEGDMGPMYGYQWRYFNKSYNNDNNDNNDNNIGIDQLYNLIEEIKQNPNSRRLIMTDFNPAQVNEGVLYPCHSLVLQFYVNDKDLSVKMYQRSADVFLGLPFNIASTSLLLCIIAKLTKLNPKFVSISLGDCHLYNEHLKCCYNQLDRNTFKLPKLYIPDFNSLKEVENSNFSDYKIIDYNYHPLIKAKMVA